jgi:hypothetical protein
MKNLYISATMGEATMYGLYAVPVDSTGTVTTQPSESTTEVLLGDVNSDGSVDAVDVLTLKKYLLTMIDITDINSTNADVDGSTSIDVVDLLQLKKYVLGMVTLG